MSKPLIDELIKKLLDSEKDQYDFCDIVDLSNGLSRHLHINGEIDPLIADSIESYIRFFNCEDEQNGIPIEEREPIKIYIDTPGGDLVAGFTLIDTIRMSETPVWTINIGAAYSCGFFIFMSGHKRFAYPHSSFLFHEGSAGTQGDAGKFRNFADFYKRELDTMKSLVLEYTEIGEDLYQTHLKDDWWMDANEALELGVCDEIADKLVY